MPKSLKRNWGKKYGARSNVPVKGQDSCSNWLDIWLASTPHEGAKRSPLILKSVQFLKEKKKKEFICKEKNNWLVSTCHIKVLVRQWKEDANASSAGFCDLVTWCTWKHFLPDGLLHAFPCNAFIHNAAVAALSLRCYFLLRWKTGDTNGSMLPFMHDPMQEVFLNVSGTGWMQVRSCGKGIPGLAMAQGGLVPHMLTGLESILKIYVKQNTPFVRLTQKLAFK